MSIFASDENSPLTAEFEAACNDPKGLDCGFEKQRCESGFANFGFPPDKAAEMREKELARIAAELEAEYDDEDDLPEDDWEEEEFGDLPELPPDDSEYDRFEESYGFDDGDEEEIDNWE